MYIFCFAAILSFISISLAQAQAVKQLDVPYVPTPYVVIEEMLRLASIRPDDFLIDLGSGDGRVLITAAQRYGARGLGVDLDEELVAMSQYSAAEAGITDRVQFLNQDLFQIDLSPATVITMYLVPRVMMRLQDKLYALKPGTRLISHDFDLGEWRPDAVTQIRKNTFLWVVPAKISGPWVARFQLQNEVIELQINWRQKFQEIDGYAKINGRGMQVWQAKLVGNRIGFIIVDDRDRDRETSLYFEGVVDDGLMTGQLRRGTGNVQVLTSWQAERFNE